jgi:hypothetical protein
MPVVLQQGCGQIPRRERPSKSFVNEQPSVSEIRTRKAKIAFLFATTTTTALMILRKQERFTLASRLRKKKESTFRKERL